jgi:hypothetical protein
MEITEMRDIILKFLLLFLLVGFIAFGSWYSERIKGREKKLERRKRRWKSPVRILEF